MKGEEEDEKDSVDHSPLSNTIILFFDKFYRLKKDVPFHFLLQGQLSGARAQRLTGKQDLEGLFCPTQRASWLGPYESTLIYGAILSR